MTEFHQVLLDRYADLLDRFRPHRFMTEVAAGTFPADRFERWACQDYLFIRQLERFLNHLAVRSPREFRRTFFETALNLGGHIETFEKIAEQSSIDLTEARPSFAGHAYAHFLLATVHVRSFAEATAACYATQHAYYEGWSAAKRDQTKPSPWQGFIEQRTSPEFGAWVERLGGFIDAVAVEADEDRLERMSETFRQTLHYQLECWETVIEGRSW